MAEPNPYRPPDAYVDDVSSPADEGTFIESGRSVPAGQGWAWIAEAFELFKKRAGAWILTGVVFGVLVIGLSFIPIVGWVLTTLLFPLAMGGIMLGCRELQRDGGFGVSWLFAGFQNRAGDLVVLGVLSILGWLVVFIPVFLVIGAAMFRALFLGGDPSAIAGFGTTVALGMLMMLALSIPVYMALWFAPALVVFRERTPMQAVRESFFACLKNIVPFLIYGIVMLVLVIVASIPFGLGLIVLGPVILASVYTAYRDIFYAPD